MWIVDEVILGSDSSHFLYKYVIEKEGKMVNQEKGFNRVADLDILSDHTLSLSRLSSTNSNSVS